MTPDTLNGIRSTILEGYALSTKQAVDLLGAHEEALVALRELYLSSPSGRSLKAVEADARAAAYAILSAAGVFHD